MGYIFRNMSSLKISTVTNYNEIMPGESRTGRHTDRETDSQVLVIWFRFTLIWVCNTKKNS